MIKAEYLLLIVPVYTRYRDRGGALAHDHTIKRAVDITAVAAPNS